MDYAERAAKTYANYSKYRDKKHLTDNKIATRAGISSVTITHWKRGDYTPKDDKINAIAQVLGISSEKITNYK